MMGMEKMIASMTGLTPDEMKAYVKQAIELLVSLNDKLENIERNSVEANERLKRIEKSMKINEPLQIVERTGTDG